jgi:hypothetical protein
LALADPNAGNATVPLWESGVMGQAMASSTLMPRA